MAAYADYEFYLNEYLGNAIAEEDFPRLATRATEYIYGKTQWLSDKVTGKGAEMVKKATCAIAEIILDENIMEATAFSGGQSVSSESVGSWSKSYSSTVLSASEVEYLEKRKLDALLLYLGNIPAFYPVFRVKSYRCVPGGH